MWPIVLAGYIAPISSSKWARLPSVCTSHIPMLGARLYHHYVRGDPLDDVMHIISTYKNFLWLSSTLLCNTTAVRIKVDYSWSMVITNSRSVFDFATSQQDLMHFVVLRLNGSRITRAGHTDIRRGGLCPKGFRPLITKWGYVTQVSLPN